VLEEIVVNYLNIICSFAPDAGNPMELQTLCESFSNVRGFLCHKDDTCISSSPPRESNDNNRAAERQALVTNHSVILFMTNYFGISALIKRRESKVSAIFSAEKRKNENAK
jgi:hypothetical protein